MPHRRSISNAHRMAELVAIVMAAQLTLACGEEDRYEFLHATPGERVPCLDPDSTEGAQPWAVVIVPGSEPGCGIGFGPDRVEEALADVADASPGMTEDDVILGGDDPREDWARAVVVATRRTDGVFQVEYGWSLSCDPAVFDSSELCEGCEIECEKAIDVCETPEGPAGCCEPPPACDEQNPCCPGQVCVDAPAMTLRLDAGPACADSCTTDADCGALCCREIAGTDQRACLPPPSGDGPGGESCP